VTCPCCRRRTPAVSLLRHSRGDFGVLDYPAEVSESRGAYGFVTLDYFNWHKLEVLPSETWEAVFIYLNRLSNTYHYLDSIRLLVPDFVRAYTAGDDFVLAYRREGVSWNGY
jgi:hypothetical protein